MEDEIKQKVFQQVMDIWIIPEIERRKKLGKISGNFVLSKAQVVFSLISGNRIRINEEVRAIAECRAKKAVNKGDLIYEQDVDNIENIKLTDDDYNCAHITLLRFKDNWIVAFDAKYNEKSREHLLASKEFYESAKDNLEKNRLRPFFENAFASAELSIKSVLLSQQVKKILHNKNHRVIVVKFNEHCKSPEVKTRFNPILSKLNLLRSSARYLSSEDFKKENPREILSILDEMIRFAEESIK
jgi:uncharacterized protein (UPF0332 family)